MGQWSGSVTFWYGSGCGYGFSDPYLSLTDPNADPAPDPALFVSDLYDANKKPFFSPSFTLKVHLHLSSKIKSHKEVTKQQKSRLF